MAAGVIVMVRSAPLPSKTILEFGTRTVFDDIAVTTSELVAVTRSETVRMIGDVDELVATDKSPRSLIVGGVVSRKSSSMVVTKTD